MIDFVSSQGNKYFFREKQMFHPEETKNILSEVFLIVNNIFGTRFDFIEQNPDILS